MIEEQKIQAEIEALEKELAGLKDAHSAMVKEEQARQQRFQQAVVSNQNRFQQLTGAVAHLRKLLNGENPPEQNAKPT